MSYFKLKFLWIHRVISVKKGFCVYHSRGLTNKLARKNIINNISGLNRKMNVDVIQLLYYRTAIKETLKQSKIAPDVFIIHK